MAASGHGRDRPKVVGMTNVVSHGVTFYLGTHMPSWLDYVDVPLFISDRRLKRYKTHKPAVTSWALDSGGFTELSLHGRWVTSPEEYAHRIDQYAQERGKLSWASPQDYMCEPHMLSATGLTIETHQHLSTLSVCELRTQTDVHVIPVVQGWEVRDYVRHVDIYAEAGIDLMSEPLVGVGSICRRQATTDAANIARALQPLPLHAFGAKQDALRLYGHLLTSCDSMAWSFGGRYKPDPACCKRSCANCLHYALAWRTKLMEAAQCTAR